MAELTLPAGSTPAPPVAASFDETALMERVEGDTELLSEIVELFREDSPRLLGEVRAALAAGDAVALKRAAHTLKGAASNFGAAAVVAAAVELETMGRSGDLTGAGPVQGRLEMALRALDVAFGRLVG